MVVRNKWCPCADLVPGTPPHKGPADNKIDVWDYADVTKSICRDLNILM